MTEGPHVRHDKPRDEIRNGTMTFLKNKRKEMCVRVWLEVGHACEPRVSALGRALALDWRVWVRGSCGADISQFVHKVVFHLHPASAFVYPKRVIQEPPYEIQESGCASIDIPIHVYLKHSIEPKIIRLRYRLRTEGNAQGSSESQSVSYDVENPSEQLWKALMQGGGEVVARTANHALAGKLLVLDCDHKPAKTMKTKKHKFAEPHDAPRDRKHKKLKQFLVEEFCSKCGESTNVDFRKQLRSAAMTDDEINRVSQLYMSYSSYEKSEEALMLPPVSDPIYRVPELPATLRGALAAFNDATDVETVKCLSS